MSTNVWNPTSSKGSGGSVTPGTVLPVADPAGVTVDTTTYDNTVTGVGKLTTLVLPQDTVVLAIAIEGDAFPRWLIESDPQDGMQLGDGTYDPYNGPTGNGHAAEMFIGQDGTFAVQGAPGGVPFSLSLGYNGSANRGHQSALTGPIAIGTAAAISSGTGAPVTGGEVGDIYIRTDGGALSTIYRCTTAGTAGNAVWAGIL